MNFGVAKFFGAIDKRFQNKYNYLIDLLSKALTTLDTGKTTIAIVRETLMPIGYVYLSSNVTSPATLFGFGTWTQIKDTFILTAGDTYTAGATGGAATVTLDTTMIPSHRHDTGLYGGGSSTLEAHEVYDSTANINVKRYTDYTGGGLAHNNMPPYKVYYAWERTA